MTYEQWCANSKALIASADAYNDWRRKKQYMLLNKIAPRISKLGKQMYMGCGFHYDLERRLGQMIINLHMPAQFSANHLDKVQSQQIDMMLARVGYKLLIETVHKAEKSIPQVKADMRKITIEIDEELKDMEESK